MNYHLTTTTNKLSVAWRNQIWQWLEVVNQCMDLLG